MITVKYQNLIFEWLKWQFFEMPKFLLSAWGNLLRFGLNYFSTPLLIKTLFSPWRKYKWFYPKGFDPWIYFETFFSNVIFRTLGFIFKSLLIIAGVLFEIFILFAGLFVFLGWFLLPLILIFGAFHGIRLFLLT